MRPDVWAEIDLSAIAHNIGQLKSLLAPGVKMMAVVKANAYGHGLVPVARQSLASGADCLGVARLAEAVELRKARISAPILIFGYTPPDCIGELISYRLSQTVYSLEIAEKLAKAARRQDTRLPVHVNVDTGMGRLGIVAGTAGLPGAGVDVDQRAVEELNAIGGLSGLSVEGIYTHFATADHEDKTFAQDQLSLFQLLTAQLPETIWASVDRHTANSAAIMDIPGAHMDMVRAGIAIYGLLPSAAVSSSRIDLRPAMRLKTRIIHLKKVQAGFSVSYGATARTRRPTTIATVSIGYADGYNRLLSSRGRMGVRGQSVPVIGRVCMDQTMLDVGHIRQAEIGDEVVVFGDGRSGEPSVSALAEMLDTISYEVVSGISNRVPRKYSSLSK